MEAKLIEVVRRLKEFDNRGQAWLKLLPSDINMAFIDNGYIDAMHMANQTMFQALFGDFSEDVAWFLYEWNPESNNIFWTYENKGTPEEKEIEWLIDSESAYYSYLEKAC